MFVVGGGEGWVRVLKGPEVRKSTVCFGNDD